MSERCKATWQYQQCVLDAGHTVPCEFRLGGDAVPPTINEKQVGGKHYSKGSGPQHWDIMWDLYRESWFVGAITKYIFRYRLKHKDNVAKQHEDLLKGLHYYLKLLDLEGVDKKRIKELVGD